MKRRKRQGQVEPKVVTQNEVSIVTTLLRTLSLTGMTLAFLAVLRFWAPATHVMQEVAGSAAWARLAGLLRIETGLGREQFIFVGMVVVCFALALIVQGGALLVVQRLARKKASD